MTLQQAYSPALCSLQRLQEPWRWSSSAQGDSRWGSKDEMKSLRRWNTAPRLGYGLLLSARGGWGLAAPVHLPGQSRITGLVRMESEACISKFFDVRSGRNLCTPEGVLCLGIKAAGLGVVSRGGRQVVSECTANGTPGQGEVTSATSEGEAALPQNSVDMPTEEGATGEGKEPASEAEIGNAIRALREEKVPAGLQDPSATSDFWKGVLEETQRIEWPTFSKVLGTTGVVVAMILGSSVVLLTVNALLSQLSDSFFKNI